MQWYDRAGYTCMDDLDLRSFIMWFCDRWKFETMFFKVWTAKKMLKTMVLNCAFFRNLKRCFGSLNCWENFKKADRLIGQSATIWNDVKCGADLSLSKGTFKSHMLLYILQWKGHTIKKRNTRIRFYCVFAKLIL